MTPMPTVMIQKVVLHVNVKMDSMVMDLYAQIETNVKLITSVPYLLIALTCPGDMIANVKLDLPVSQSLFYREL